MNRVQAEQHSPAPGSVIATSALLTGEVYDCDRKRHGHIRDVLLNTETGKISGAVLAYGGFLGVCERRVMVPWTSLGLDAGSQQAQPRAARDCLKITLGPDRYKWLDVSD